MVVVLVSQGRCPNTGVYGCRIPTQRSYLITKRTSQQRRLWASFQSQKALRCAPRARLGRAPRASGRGIWPRKPIPFLMHLCDLTIIMRPGLEVAHSLTLQRRNRRVYGRFELRPGGCRRGTARARVGVVCVKNTRLGYAKLTSAPAAKSTKNRNLLLLSSTILAAPNNDPKGTRNCERRSS